MDDLSLALSGGVTLLISDVDADIATEAQSTLAGDGALRRACDGVWSAIRSNSG